MPEQHLPVECFVNQDSEAKLVINVQNKLPENIFTFYGRATDSILE